MIDGIIKQGISLIMLVFAFWQCTSHANHPNVIILLTDDQGYGDLEVHGHPYLKTPNMNKLYESSIRLTNFHVSPVCTPTRSQLMTGLDAMHNGAYSAHGQHHLLDTAYKLLPEFFLENGYNTALYGKWHLGGNSIGYRPHERGFQDAVHFLRGGHWSHPNPWNIDCMDDQYYHNGIVENYKGYATDLWFDLGKEFILRSKAERKPFLLYLAVNPPHIPLLVPEKYREPYMDLGLENKSINFYAMIGTVDENMGSLMNFLKKENLWENTVFIFLTDNGSALREQEYNGGMRGKKTSVYEGGHRVPAFIHWPQGNLGAPRDIPVMLQCQDLAPTLLEMCNLNITEQPFFHGSSFAPLFHGQAGDNLNNRKLVVQHSEKKYEAAVMQNNWRLIKGKELYNITSDLGQKNDVADQYPKIVEELRDYYESWWEKARLEPVPYYITDSEEIKLTAYDWYDGKRVFNWPHLRAGDKGNGKYKLVFEKGGTYRVALRRWPKEANAGIRAGVPAFMPFDSFLGELQEGVALNIVKARVRLGDQVKEKSISENDLDVSFEFTTVQGETSLQTWFIDDEGEEFGAYYVYITKN